MRSHHRSRLLLPAIAGGLSLALVACGSSTASVATTTASTAAATTTGAPTTVTATTTSTAATTTTTVAPATTQAATTTAAPTTVADTTPVGPTTTGVPVQGLNPACQPIAASGGSASIDEATLDTFGPLQIAPALDIALPRWRDTPTTDAQSVAPVTARIPGGVLVGVGPSSGSQGDGGMLSAVDYDGHVRWQICTKDTPSAIYVASASNAPKRALVAFQVDRGGSALSYDLRFLSLADGTTTGTLGDALSSAGVPAALAGHTNVVASNGDVIVVGPDYTATLGSGDEYVRVELATGKVATIAAPPSLVGQSASNYFSLNDAGDMLLEDPSKPNALAAVLHDGTWHTDAAALDAARPVRVWFTTDGGPSMHVVGESGSGATVWSRNDLTPPMAEGWFWGQDGKVGLAISCTSPADPTTANEICHDWRLVGLDLATGATKWELPDIHVFSEMGDGHVLVLRVPAADDTKSAWIMVDEATGKAIDGQEWATGGLFANGCCGEDEWVGTRLSGGVVIGTDYDRIAVYVPKGAGLASHRVNLP